MSTPDRVRDEAEAAAHLRVVNAELQRIGLPAWLQLNVPTAQLKALVAISGESGVSVTGLAHRMSIGEPAASQVVEQLVRRGYVERVPDATDRRRVVVSATPTGAELVAELLQGRRQHVERWLSMMADSDVAALARGLKALAAAAQVVEAEVRA